MTEDALKRYHTGQLKQSAQEQDRHRHDEIERFLAEGSVVNLKQVLHTQVSHVSQQVQIQFPGVPCCHVLDRQCDGVPTCEFLGLDLQDWFVIRLKGSRNSNTMQ